MIHCTYLQEVCLLGYLIIDRKCNKLLLYIFIRPHQHILTGKYQIIIVIEIIWEKNFTSKKKLGLKSPMFLQKEKLLNYFPVKFYVHKLKCLYMVDFLDFELEHV
jgi:hypothetical protein